MKDYVTEFCKSFAGEPGYIGEKMIPKGTKVINKNDGMYCRTCRTYHYGDPKRIKLTHKCHKMVTKRKYILFGKKETKIVETGEKPDLIPISEVKK